MFIYAHMKLDTANQKDRSIGADQSFVDEMLHPPFYSFPPLFGLFFPSICMHLMFSRLFPKYTIEYVYLMITICNC